MIKCEKDVNETVFAVSIKSTVINHFVLNNDYHFVPFLLSNKFNMKICNLICLKLNLNCQN